MNKFILFLKAIYINARKHPEKLHDLNEVWKEFDELLKDVPDENE